VENATGGLERLHPILPACLVVVDITNPLDFATFDSLTVAVAADGSATAEIAAALPQSRVVKAFNTVFAAALASGNVRYRPRSSSRATTPMRRPCWPV
jgi:predicted dinucleotide-binding enzyme